MELSNLTNDECEMIASKLDLDFVSLGQFAMTCKQMRDAVRPIQEKFKQRENGKHSNCMFVFNRNYFKLDPTIVHHAEYAKILVVPSVDSLRELAVREKIYPWPIYRIHPSHIWMIKGRFVNTTRTMPALHWYIRIGVRGMLSESDDVNILRKIPYAVCKKLVQLWNNDPSLAGHRLLTDVAPYLPDMSFDCYFDPRDTSCTKLRSKPYTLLYP